jgi:hypothetical protein
VLYVQAGTLADPLAGHHYRARFERRTIMTLCPDNKGVCQRVDLESASEDLVRLVNQLGDEVEVEVQADELRKIDNKLRKIIGG